jgi:hypothetical protein
MTPQDVFDRHVAALVAGDLDALTADYAPDALVVTPTGVSRGRDEIRGLLTGMLPAFQDVRLAARVAVFADDALLLHWSAESRSHRVDDGVDTFVFRDGAIALQTISCTLVPRD